MIDAAEHGVAGQPFERTAGEAAVGDAIFAVLCACGHNIRKILAHLRHLLVLLIAVLLEPLKPGRSPFSRAVAA